VEGWSISGRVIFITGGARGIGAETGRALAHRGATVVLADIDAEMLERTARTMTPEPLTVALDVTDPAACESAVERALEEHGRLDVVWANAGIGSFGPLALTSPTAWRRTIEVNLLGAYYTVRAALGSVIEQRGFVAVTASAASFAHAPGMSAYAASKAGVEAMCNSLRTEVAHLGVGVASIHPTWIDTDMVREGEAEQRAFHRLREAMRPPFGRTYPLQRAVDDIVAGLEQRRRRICTPRFVQLAHALRPALTTRFFERDQLAAAPELTRVFEAEIGERGVDGASVSERIAEQVERTPSGA
jgi:NAD(P)-dependent dehydrogenase (short-subunit alcohol dehydrogenase family)